MRIGIDLAPLTYTLTGIGVYVQCLVESVSKLDGNTRWHFPVLTELPLPNYFRWRMHSKISRNLHSRIDIAPRFAFLHDRRQSRPRCRLAAAEMELFHVTNAQSQFDDFDLPMVITVHDLAWMRLPKSEMPAPRIFGLNRLQSLIERANHVICDSECTRTDVLELVGRKPEHVTTIHLAQRRLFKEPKDELQRVLARKGANGGRPYFLAVSTIEPRKNYVRLVRAFAQIQEKFPELRLIIAGAKRSAWNDVRETIRATGMSENIHVLGHVADQKILELLWGCEALVYPSLYEGFGLPALEAMACGTPVICSAAGSLGEVVGNAAVIVDPLHVDSIAEGMRSVAQFRELQTQLRKKSLEHASKFSWDKTAEQTIAVYRNVIG